MEPGGDEDGRGLLPGGPLTPLPTIASGKGGGSGAGVDESEGEEEGEFTGPGRGAVTDSLR